MLDYNRHVITHLISGVPTGRGNERVLVPIDRLSAALKRRALFVRSLRDAVFHPSMLQFPGLSCPALLWHQCNRAGRKHCHLVPDFEALFLCLVPKLPYR